jgi:hypothetical protein
MASVRRITLSFRSAEVGGDVSVPPAVSDAHTLACAQHLVLLIHGYNNDQQAAAEAYDGFHARQRDLDANGRYGLGRTFVEVYWPGDAAWGVASFLYYMRSIGHARQTAQALADDLSERFAASSVRIDIVAHSMGCRLALELLRALAAKQATVDIARIVFMAGAVPTFMLVDAMPPRRLRPGYDRVLREGARSLYSGADRVLAWAFPAGQTLAPGDEGFVPVALGHAFWVDATVPLDLGQDENPGAGHGDYWGWNTQPRPLARARKAAAEVRGYLQFASAGSRQVATRPVVEASATEARARAATRATLARGTAAYWPGG